MLAVVVVVTAAVRASARVLLPFGAAADVSGDGLGIIAAVVPAWSLSTATIRGQ